MRWEIFWKNKIKSIKIVQGKLKNGFRFVFKILYQLTAKSESSFMIDMHNSSFLNQYRVKSKKFEEFVIKFKYFEFLLIVKPFYLC
jgi:hypothetical protein